jgi:catechol 2,3-dioxygenase-like lactoylglutathione lyase family enzyme
MALTTPRIARLSLTTADPVRAAEFYARALGFERAGTQRCGGAAFAALMGVESEAAATTLRLGGEEVTLLAFATPGRPYPADRSADDLWFQHMAIVVSDMAAAYARLRAVPGWSAISTSGPQDLPAASGGVAAYKFRDPEGHPLELLSFPPGRVPPRWSRPTPDALFLGIDHSAITVADTRRSLELYERGLGLSRHTQSTNQGVEQERLDNVRAPLVRVTGLRWDKAPPPYLELLCYEEPRRRRVPLVLKPNDVAAMRVEIEGLDPDAVSAGLGGPAVVQLDDGRRAVRITDPDGHDLLVFSG